MQLTFKVSRVKKLAKAKVCICVKHKDFVNGAAMLKYSQNAFWMAEKAGHSRCSKESVNNWADLKMNGLKEDSDFIKAILNQINP